MVSEVMLPHLKLWVQNHGRQNCYVSINNFVVVIQ